MHILLFSVSLILLGVFYHQAIKNINFDDLKIKINKILSGDEEEYEIRSVIYKADDFDGKIDYFALDDDDYVFEPSGYFDKVTKIVGDKVYTNEHEAMIAHKKPERLKNKQNLIFNQSRGEKSEEKPTKLNAIEKQRYDSIGIELWDIHKKYVNTPEEPLINELELLIEKYHDNTKQFDEQEYYIRDKYSPSSLDMDE